MTSLLMRMTMILFPVMMNLLPYKPHKDKSMPSLPDAIWLILSRNLPIAPNKHMMCSSSYPNQPHHHQMYHQRRKLMVITMNIICIIDGTIPRTAVYCIYTFVLSHKILWKALPKSVFLNCLTNINQKNNHSFTSTL